MTVFGYIYILYYFSTKTAYRKRYSALRVTAEKPLFYAVFFVIMWLIFLPLSMKNFFRIFLTVFLLFSATTQVYAQNLSILPYTTKSNADCVSVIANFEVTGDIVMNDQALKDYSDASKEAQNASNAYTAAEIAGEDSAALKKAYDESAKKAKEAQAKAGVSDLTNPEDLATQNDILGCAIKTGRISLQMIPYFITYISNFLLSIVGLISVLFIVLGGYQYVAGGLTDKKEKGKEYIKHALMGMAIAILAWIIVNTIITIVTS